MKKLLLILSAFCTISACTDTSFKNVNFTALNSQIEFYKGEYNPEKMPVRQSIGNEPITLSIEEGVWNIRIFSRDLDTTFFDVEILNNKVTTFSKDDTQFYLSNFK
jgi:hypothetical protein